MLPFVLSLCVGAPQAPPPPQAPPCRDAETARVRLHVHADPGAEVLIDGERAGGAGEYVTPAFPKGRAYTWEVTAHGPTGTFSKFVNAAAGDEVIVDLRAPPRLAGPAPRTFGTFQPAPFGGGAACGPRGG